MKNISRTNWEKVDSLSDDSIDTSELPPLSPDFFASAEREDYLASERKARHVLEQEYGTPLPETSLVIGRKANGEERCHKFDGVSPDGNIVMEVRPNAIVPKPHNPYGRYFSAIKWVLLGDLYLLSRVNAPTKLLVLTDKALYDIASKDLDGIFPEGVMLVYCQIE